MCHHGGCYRNETGMKLVVGCLTSSNRRFGAYDRPEYRNSWSSFYHK